MKSIENMNIQELFENLEKSKKAVLNCLEADGVLVDMHSLEYWARYVELLRSEIKKRL